MDADHDPHDAVGIKRDGRVEMLAEGRIMRIYLLRPMPISTCNPGEAAGEH